MTWQIRWSVALVVLTLANVGVHGQEAQTGGQLPQPKPDMPPPAANVIAATVNGQAIAEIAVYRGVLAEDRKNYELLRKEILDNLIENALIDQYLLHLKIEVTPNEVNEKIAIIKAQAEKKGGLEKVLKALFITEDEMRTELTAMCRWERFVIQQSTDQTLRDFFSKNVAVFDGSQVHARHILVKTEQATKEKATAHLLQLKKWIEEESQRELAKLPVEARTDKQAAEILEKTFADVAGKQSACPSKENGGDLRWFQRAGMMVEPFARTAFALKTYQMSDVVTTQFGYHLIMTVDRKPGKDVKYDDVKVLVREVYSDRLREAVIQSMRPNAKITINPIGK
jgi:peptidyl-prolyl cis-trans isomerase C